MSQKTIFIVIIAIILVVNHADSKRTGCASFGHSCYGGFGKRSLTIVPSSNQDSAQPLDIPPEHPGNIALKAFQRHLQFRQDMQQQPENVEKEFKILILNTLSQVVEEAMRNMKISGDYENN